MNYKNILIFGAHPDDEIGMARSITKFSNMGARVTVVIMTDGSEGYPDVALKDSIVALRAAEARACNTVLGIHEKILMPLPDLGLVNDKETVQKFMKIIREVKPDAIFTHGPYDEHKDHVATHQITLSAYLHAGEPVSAILGAPWKTPYLYYYKGVKDPLPKVMFDVSDCQEKQIEALATQKSQLKVFRKTAEEFAEMAAALKKRTTPVYDTFWIAEPVILTDLLPLGIDAPDNYYGTNGWWG